MEKKIERYMSPVMIPILMSSGVNIRAMPPRTREQQKKIEEKLRELDRLVGAVRK
jgi:hypothetical protein